MHCCMALDFQLAVLKVCFVFQDGVTFLCNNILSSPGSHAPLHSGMAQYKECLIMFVYV